MNAPDGRRETTSPIPTSSRQLNENQNNIHKKQAVTPKATAQKKFTIPRVPIEKAMNENKEMSTDDRLSKLNKNENKPFR